MGWRNGPTHKENWPSDVDYMMFIDENGDSNLAPILKKIQNKQVITDEEKYFTITGVIIKKRDLPKIRETILDLKNKFWKDGKYLYDNVEKRVWFHSREIRKRKEAFSPKTIDYNSFVIDLSKILVDMPYIIFSSTIDLERHCKKYDDPVHPYNLCLDFVLERLVKYYLNEEKVAIMLESRGKDKDYELLTHIKRKIDHGTYYVPSSYFKKIKGVYFNPKWCKSSMNQKSFFGLEIADLISYPIYKYMRSNCKDMAFQSIESKIYGFPRYQGQGIKKFP